MKIVRTAPLLFSLFLFVWPARAGDLDTLLQQSRQKNLADHPYWKMLLHMRHGWWGEKSEIDGKNFFLSPHGRTDAQAELNATITALFDPLPPDSEDQHPQCRYPERTHWLKSQLNFPPSFVEYDCDRFESWRAKLDPRGISLVFASYYMNNPASMYGHTFFRLNRKGKDAEAHLLDYTINFSANTNTKNGILFALLGLTGGFPGVFSTEPYYIKVQKYNNLESRDLWEYALNVEQSGIDRLVRHLWEMGPTTMSYYFLNRNCSYQLLPLLEIARPDLDLSKKFTFRAIPLDTLRAVINTPGFVGDVKFRPSHLRKMCTERAKLTSEEQAIAVDFTNRPERDPKKRLMSMEAERRAIVLDAAYDYLRYRSGFYREQSETVRTIENELLLLRSQAGARKNIQVEQPAAPETAHGSGRIGVGSGLTRGGSFEEVSVRGSLHDLESDPTGFTEGSQLEMFHFRLRYDNQRGKMYWQEGTLVNVRSLTPWEPWVHVPSWGVKIGFENARDLERDPEDRTYFGVSGGSGLTLRVPCLKRGLGYALVEGDSGVGGVFEEHYRLGLGGSAGLVFSALPWWRVHISASYRRFGVGDISSANTMRFVQAFVIRKEVEMRLEAERQNAYKELTLKLNRFF